MERPRLQSTLARAVVPVAAGVVFFAILGLALWGAAALIARDSDEATTYLAPMTYEMGSASMIAEIITEDGPIVLQDLVGDDQNIVLSWDEPRGFAIHLAHPGDRDAACAVVVTKSSGNLQDCDGRLLTVDDLALPPEGIFPRVSAAGVLTLDLTPSP